MHTKGRAGTGGLRPPSFAVLALAAGLLWCSAHADFVTPESPCSSETENQCDAHVCFSYGNGRVEVVGTGSDRIEEQCDDFGTLNDIVTGGCSELPEWNRDVAGIVDGCYDNGTVASSHTCDQLACSDYATGVLNQTKAALVTTAWSTSFGVDYGWTNLATACEVEAGQLYNDLVTKYEVLVDQSEFAEGTGNGGGVAAYYLQAISTFTVCRSCGNGVRQEVNDTTVDLNFFNRYYRSGSLFADTGEVTAETFNNQFNEGCDDGNLISGDGCSGCNYKPGSNGDDPDDVSDPTTFGQHFPFACVCSPSTFGSFFCPQQACQVEDGWVCREHTNGTSYCRRKECGNGYVQFEQNEECDDGNTVDGDGCSRNCTIELGYDCTEAENADGRWRTALYFSEPASQAKSLCAYLPRFETPEFEVGFLVEFYNATRNLTTWTNSAGWAEALDAAGNVEDIDCTILRTLDDPYKYVSCFEICNTTISDFVCGETDLVLVPFNFSRTCLDQFPMVLSNTTQLLKTAFPVLSDLVVQNFNYSLESNAEYAQHWYLERGVNLTATWIKFDNETGNFTYVLQLTSSSLADVADDVVQYMSSDAFAVLLWETMVDARDLCIRDLPTVLNSTIVRTCQSPNITYHGYHQQWCDNCCTIDPPAVDEEFYFDRCDDYWYLTTIEASHMRDCWGGRGIDVNSTCDVDVCGEGSELSAEYCTRFNLYKDVCGRPRNNALTTPIFVVRYLLTSDPCGKCRSDEVCPVWYGLECGVCDGCQDLADESGQCPCDALFQEDIFEVAGEIHITKLSMRANNISGTIIDSFANLTYIEELFMTENKLQYLSPDIDWSRLSSLRKMHLSDNRLEGTLLPTLKFLPALEELYLDNNLLNEIAEDAFSNATCCTPESGQPCEGDCMYSLLVLDVTNNNLTGNVPGSLSRLPALMQIELSQNHLSSFGSFFLSADVQIANFMSNELADELADVGDALFATGPPSRLVALDLAYNRLWGSLPNSVGALSNVRFLSLRDNAVSGSLPFALGALTRLQELDLFGNQLTGRVNPNFNLLTSLRVVDLSKNSIEGLPQSLVGLDQLRELYVQSNLLSSLPADTGALSSLQVLDVSYNSIARLPASLELNDQLEELHARRNRLSSTAQLPDFSACGSLRYLDLSGNALEGTLRDEFGITELRHLNLSRNYGISGSVPPSVTLPERLVELDLSFNSLERVPDSFHQLTALQTLDLSNNFIDQDIPDSIGSMPSLTRLDLHNNSFNGDVPVSLASLDMVRFMDLSDNSLDGTVPTELSSNMVSLETFRVNQNLLRGTIPSELMAMPAVTELLLGGNSFGGPLPDTLCDKVSQYEEFSITGNGYWCPFPCSQAEFSGLACKNCPSSTCPGSATNCNTCNGRGSCDFENVFAPSALGTCSPYTSLFSGDLLETLDCPQNCTNHGTCNNEAVFVQCPCEESVSECSLDLSSTFYRRAALHPALADDMATQRQVSNYSLTQDPAVALSVYDPEMDQATPSCAFGARAECYQFDEASGTWVRSGECWYAEMLYATCACDEDFGGLHCAESTAVEDDETTVWISSAPLGARFGAAALAVLLGALLLV